MKCNQFHNCCDDFAAKCDKHPEIFVKKNVRRGPLPEVKSPFGGTVFFVPVAVMCAIVVAVAPVIAIGRMAWRSDDSTPPCGRTFLLSSENYEQLPVQSVCGDNHALVAAGEEENHELLPKEPELFLRSDTEDIVLLSAEEGEPVATGADFLHLLREPSTTAAEFDLNIGDVEQGVEPAALIDVEQGVEPAALIRED